MSSSSSSSLSTVVERERERKENKKEKKYLKLCQKVIEKGIFSLDRTKVGTWRLPSQVLKFSLENHTLPLLTTKPVFLKGILTELLWFVSGSTDATILQNQGVKIWSGNTSRAFLDQRGLGHYQEGDIGPGYGFQWRHASAEYRGKDHNYTGQGIDQLQNVIDLIKKDPENRRMLVSAWNVADLDKIALPPCHYSFGFSVLGGKKLYCTVNMRSADLGLGVPFNIASYSLLTHMIAHLCGLEATGICIIMNDAHVYSTHVDALKIQIEREPFPFPTLKFNPNKVFQTIDDFEYDDFIIENYQSHKERLIMPMAI